MTEKIGLQAVLETGDFIQGVKSYDSGIEAMEAANEEFVASTDDVTKGLSSVDDAAAESGKSAVELAAQMELVEQAYDAISGAIGEAIELAELGSQAERAEERFRAFAGEIGDADELLEAFQRGAGGTVDKLTAMTSAGRLLQMGLVQNNDEMEQVTEMAIRLGDQTQSAGDRIADFAALLANQSIPRLDNFGISSGKVRTRIEELQKAFPGMSREVAFSKAVFEEGGVALDILGERTVDAGTKMEQARADIQNMRIEVGQALLPVIASAFGFIENLNTGTLALIATFGGAAGVFIKFSGGLEGAVANMGKLATKMGTSTAALGALSVATVVLAEAASNLKETLDDMSATQDAAQEAAGTLGSQVQALVDDGMSLGDAMDQVGNKVNNATANFNDARVLGVIPLKNAFNAASEFSKTMEDATYSLQGALIANTETHAQYVEQVIAYNAGIDDSSAKLEIYTEKQFAMMQAHQEGIGFFSETIDRLQGYTTTLKNVAVVMETEYEPAWMSAQRVEEGFQQLSQQGNQRMQERERILGDLGQATKESTAIMEESARAAENRASIEEKAARIEDMQATSALAAAAALEAKRQKDIETVQAEQALAQSVLDASDAMIAQTFISGLDPEQMGLTAYREAVEDIQLAFGLATPESIRLAQGITQGLEAANTGAIAYDQLDNLINDLIADSATGADTFEKYGIAIDKSADASQELTGSSQALGIELTGINDDAQVAASGMDAATESTRELDSAMADTAGAAPGYGAAIGSGLRSGMEPQMDGFVASFRAKLQTLKDQLPSSEPKDPTSPLYGLGRSGEAIVHNLNAGIEAAGPTAADAASSIGESIGDALVDAIGEAAQGQIPELINSVTFELGSLTAEVGDLFGAAGVFGGLGGAAGTIFQREVLDPLEERQAGLETSIKETIKRIEKETKELDKITPEFAPEFLEGLERDVERFGSAERAIEALRTQLEQTAFLGRGAGEQFVTRQEIIAQQDAIEQWMRALGELNRIQEHRIDLQERSGENLTELNEQQERLLRLQQQQESLRFLQQQAELLELIAEKGLDAGDILGGLKLGIEADAGEVMDAMAAAMEQVIAQAEEELGIASPSKVFEQIGRETMAGMAVGIEKLMGLPVAQSAIATQAMIAAPAAIASPRNTTIDNSRTMGDVNIQGGVAGGPMSQGQLVATIRRVVKEEIRGT